MNKGKERKGPTDKQKLFVEAYLQTLNATEAARQAGYEGNDGTLATVGYENLRKPEIQKLLKQRLSQEKILTGEVISRTISQMRGSLEDFLTPEGKLDLKRAKERNQLHLLKKLELDEKGYVKKVEIYSAESARDKLMQHLGLLDAPLKQQLVALHAELAAIKVAQEQNKQRILNAIKRKAPPEVYDLILEIVGEDEEDSEEENRQTQKEGSPA